MKKASLQKRKDRKDIAVVGMACRFPGAANYREFWDNLAACRESIETIPIDRITFPEGAIGSVADPKKPRAVAGLIRRADHFDAAFFGISPREAELMDPQQRLILQACWHCLEDAGQVPSDLAGSYTGVFLGACNFDYKELLEQSKARREGHAATGTHLSLIPNRVSYFFDFTGPSVLVDTACSSSLVALHQAVMALRSGECSLALAGGVNLLFTSTSFISFANLGMLSPRGRCSTFDAAADGYVRGEGVGVLLLKPLDKALTDGDRIWGVIRGTAQNHGGHGRTLTAPNPKLQADLITTAIHDAGIKPETLGYMEAHGTGTPLGDPAEVWGLKQAFKQAAGRGKVALESARVGIGSVKTNIGHLEGAAGIAGVIKVLLAMHHRRLPGHGHWTKLSRFIKLGESPFFVVQETQAWQAPRNGRGKTLPLRAGVSSFGFGGANAHIILEESPEAAMPTWAPFLAKTATVKPSLLLLSAASPTSLKSQAECLRGYIQANDFPEGALPELAFSLQTGREALPVRLAILASNRQELCTRLTTFLDGAHGEKGLFVGQIQVETKDTVDHEPALEKASKRRLQAWLRRGEWPELAARWVRGETINWARAYQSKSTRRLRLPSYPFEERRFRPPGEKSGPVACKPRLPEHVFGKLFSDGGNERSWQLDERLPLLADHRVAGELVLPGTAVIVVATEAAQPGKTRLTMRDICWLSPWQVGGSTLKMEIWSEGEEQVFNLSSGESSSSANSHARGRVIATTSAVEETITSESWPIIQTRCPDLVEAGELYDWFGTLGLDYGPMFKPVLRIGRGAGEAWGELRGSQKPDSGLALQVALLDGAIQVAMGSLFGKAYVPEQLWLPFSIDRMTRYGDLTDRARIWVKRWELGRQSASFDIHMTAPDGRLLLELIGLTLKATSSVSPPICYVPSWATQTNIGTDQSHGHHSRMAVVWDASNQPLVEALLAYSAATTLLSVELVDRLATSSSATEHLQVGPGDWGDLTAKLKEHDSIERWVYLAPKALADHQPDPQSESRSEVQAFAALDRLFSFAQWFGEQAQIGRGTLLQLVTQNGCRIHAKSAVSPMHAALGRFATAWSRESPDWAFSWLDLESSKLQEKVPRALIGWMDRQTGRLTEPGMVAWREEMGFRPTMIPVSFRGAHFSPFRNQGVYVMLGGAGGLGLALARFLVREYGAKIALVGRRSLDPSRVAEIEAIRQLGGEVHYFQADGSDPRAMQELALTVRTEIGDIHGMFHMAMVLRDVTVANMDHDTFQQVLRAKMATCEPFYRAFAEPTLDFCVFFSSAVAFTMPAGQSHYAAACAYVDAFAATRTAIDGIPCVTMNWGAWGGAGAVANEAYLRRLSASGIYPIRTDQGLRILSRILTTRLERVMIFKGSRDRLESMGCTKEHHVIATADQWRLPRIEKVRVWFNQTHVAKPPGSEARDALERLAQAGLEAYCRAAGWWQSTAENGTAGFWRPPRAVNAAGVALLTVIERWLGEATPRSSVDSDLERVTNERADQVADWHQARSHFEHRFPDFRGHSRLMAHCLEHLEAVITGQKQPTDVLFPGAGIQLVEPIYAGNPWSDSFNQQMALGLRHWVANRCDSMAPNEKIVILEVGAGTGGTTRLVLAELASYADQIRYIFSDVSARFVSQWRATNGTGFPFLETEVIDLDADTGVNKIPTGSVDVVIATNVLHAVPRLDAALTRIQGWLKPAGLLILNELTRHDRFTTLTFGLLDGWWHPDRAVGNPSAGPLLDERDWLHLLKHTGFANPFVVGTELGPAELGQALIVAQGRGLIRSRNPTLAKQVARVVVKDRPDADNIAETQNRKPETRLASIEADLKQVIAEALHVDGATINRSIPLEMYGVDSIVSVDVVQRLRVKVPSLPQTLLFENQTVADMAAFLLEHHAPEWLATHGLHEKMDLREKTMAAQLQLAIRFRIQEYIWQDAP